MDQRGENTLNLILCLYFSSIFNQPKNDQLLNQTIVAAVNANKTELI